MEGVDRALIEKEIEYLLFVDHEDKLSMRRYVEFQPVVSDLVDLVVARSEQAANRMRDHLTYDIARALKENVTDIVYGEKKNVGA